MPTSRDPKPRMTPYPDGIHPPLSTASPRLVACFCSRYGRMPTLGIGKPEGSAQSSRRDPVRFAGAMNLVSSLKLAHEHPRRSASSKRSGRRVHCIVDIQTGIAYARTTLAFGQPPAVTRRTGPKLQSPERLSRWHAKRSVRCNRKLQWPLWNWIFKQSTR